MRIQASIPGYRQIELDLKPGSTVNDLKKAACRKLGIENELTKLLLNGKQLPENSPVAKLKSAKAPLVLDYLWARQLIVWGAQGQEKLRTATVLLAGAGAIGNEAAKNLAMLGIGRILIADRDRVEMSNISRMIFFQSKDLGKNKAEALAENLHTKYPYVETSAYRGELENMPLKLYLDSQVVLCGLDNVISRMFLTQICRRYYIPLIDAGIIGVTGRVHTYIPPNDTCPICLFPPNQYSNIVGLRNPCEGPPEQQTVPSFATSISLVSSILAQETVKIILGSQEYQATKKWPDKTGQPLRSILFVDLKNSRYTPMNVERSARCIVCGKDGTARDTASQGELSLKLLHRRDPKPEETIRKATNTPDGLLITYLETSHGTRKIEGYSSIVRRAKPGDYLRILAEAKNGEIHESILRLV
jgi:molybdopterin/thiamine biosynthesis adenylyltransferase